jgi:aerobic-type carbon monoxide dehydrogenase small subunit (CoxS/CutS family)
MGRTGAFATRCPKPVPAAFVKHDGYQCGYCTSGQICSAVAVLDEIKAGIPSHVSTSLTESPQVIDAEIRERMSGNICRCGAYSNIVEAITEVSERKARNPSRTNGRRRPPKLPPLPSAPQTPSSSLVALICSIL